MSEGEWCNVYRDGDLILRGRKNSNHICYLDGQSVNSIDYSSHILVHKGEVKNKMKRVSFSEAVETLRDFSSRDDMLGINSNSKLI